jgi:imidazole glycerol-phosphate synthase subunit HisF
MLLKNRVIPVLLLKNKGLYKTRKFKSPVYLGDPINIARIFNEKEVDELIILDTNASKLNNSPNFEFIKNITNECFMPLSYGGGVYSIDQMSKLFSIGIEKIILNTAAIYNFELVTDAIKEFGSSSIVIGIDVKRSIFGNYCVFNHSRKKNTNLKPLEYAKKINKAGAGEIFLNSVERDGTMNGYDIKLIKKITSQVNIPVIASGGAGSLDHLKEAIKLAGASAVSAGSLFVFTGKHKAVLINYPKYKILCKLLN